MLLALLKSRTPGAGATGAQGTDESLTPATRELQAANPDYALKLVSEIKKQVVGLMPTLAFKSPSAARALMSTVKGLDAALKELQQAAATMKAVGGGPIQSSAIPQPQPPGSAAPSLPNPANVSM